MKILVVPRERMHDTENVSGSFILRTITRNVVSYPFFTLDVSSCNKELEIPRKEYRKEI